MTSSRPAHAPADSSTKGPPNLSATSEGGIQARSLALGPCPIWCGLRHSDRTLRYVWDCFHLPLVYLIAMVAMSLTAISYGRMAAAFPEAGSTYSYASKALNPAIGYFAGWGMTLDYILIPMLSLIFLGLTASKLASPRGAVCRLAVAQRMDARVVGGTAGRCKLAVPTPARGLRVGLRAS